MRRAIVVMGKLPRPGHVKTRLAKSLGSAAAVALYEAFLADVLDLAAAAAENLSAEAIFNCALEPDEGLELAQGLCPDGVRAARQAQGDLGERMEAARVESGARHVVILGSDAPTMPRERIYVAFDHLDRGDYAVVGPTLDGGYDLLGLAGSGSVLFKDILWSTPQVMAATRIAALQARLQYTELELGYDLDEVADLERALEDTADGRAPRTRAAIRKALGKP